MYKAEEDREMQDLYVITRGRHCYSVKPVLLTFNCAFCVHLGRVNLNNVTEREEGVFNAF